MDRHNVHERVIAIVPMVGAGTWQDPRRPLFAPRHSGRLASEVASRGRDAAIDALGKEIIEYSYELSDDGNFAIVEFIARDRQALLPILRSTRPDVKAFERGRATVQEIETEARKVKPAFDLRKFIFRGGATTIPGGGR